MAACSAWSGESAAAMTEPLLEVIGLNKSFGGVRATDNLNLVVGKGEITP